jgi:hypothetical protein
VDADETAKSNVRDIEQMVSHAPDSQRLKVDVERAKATARLASIERDECARKLTAIRLVQKLVSDKMDPTQINQEYLAFMRDARAKEIQLNKKSLDWSEKLQRSPHDRNLRARSREANHKFAIQIAFREIIHQIFAEIYKIAQYYEENHESAVGSGRGSSHEAAVGSGRGSGRGATVGGGRGSGRGATVGGGRGSSDGDHVVQTAARVSAALARIKAVMDKGNSTFSKTRL